MNWLQSDIELVTSISGESMRSELHIKDMLPVVCKLAHETISTPIYEDVRIWQYLHIATKAAKLAVRSWKDFNKVRCHRDYIQGNK